MRRTAFIPSTVFKNKKAGTNPTFYLPVSLCQYIRGQFAKQVRHFDGANLNQRFCIFMVSQEG